jgi:hypothetical protein
MKATVHKILSERQTVYRLSPPLVSTSWDDVETAHEYVVASCAWAGFVNEVLIFPSDGESITGFGEIGGSYAEDQGHVSALKSLGYRLGGDPETILETIRRSGRNAPKGVMARGRW